MADFFKLYVLKHLRNSSQEVKLFISIDRYLILTEIPKFKFLNNILYGVLVMC